MTKHYKIFNLKIPLPKKMGLRIGLTGFAGLVKPMRGFNNSCKECPPDTQIIFWDFRQTYSDNEMNLYNIILSLKEIQKKYPYVNPIMIFGNLPDNNSYRAISPVKIPIEKNIDIVMQTPYIDRAFIRMYMTQKRKTIRLSPKGEFSVKYIMTLDNKHRDLEMSYPHLYWLHQLFNSPIFRPHDSHDIKSLTNVDYETTSW